MPADNHHTLPEHIGPRAVFGLAWPIMVSMLSYTVMGVVDTLFVGRLGTAPLAAVGLAIPAVHVLQSFPNGLMRGVKVNVAQRSGAGDHRAAFAFGWQGLWLAAAFGILVSAVASAGPGLFAWLGAGPAVAELAAEYFAVRILAAPVVFASVAITAWFQGRGDTRTPMVAALIGNGLNIALDPLLIFGVGSWAGLGFAGAATATVIAFTAQLGFMVWRFVPLMRGTPRRPRLKLLAAVWRIGSPVGLQWLVEVGAWMTFVAVLARVGEVDLAAHVLVIRIISVSFLPGHAMGEAAGVLVGHAVGAGRRAAAREAFRSALGLAVGIMVVGGLVFLTVPGWLTAPFGAEPEVAAVAHRLLLLAAAFQIFDAVAIASFGCLSGAGDTRFVMVVSIASAWLLKLPLGWALAIGLGWGAAGAWAGLTLEIVVIALIGVWRVRGSRWLDLAFERAEADFADAETVEVAVADAEVAAK